MATTQSTSYFQRTSRLQRTDQIIDIHGDRFQEVKCTNVRPDIEYLGKARFQSFHHILGTQGQVIMTAFKCLDLPQVLFIVWRDLPYYPHIELGGDLMLQEIQRNGIKHLLIDNTYVQSGWMNDKMREYFDAAWYPGLIRLGLETFGHIQSKSALGGVAFEKFKNDVQEYLLSIAVRIKGKSFSYVPIESNTQIPRPEMLEEALKKMLNKKTIL